jgi:hypothetical protein
MRRRILLREGWRGESERAFLEAQVEKHIPESSRLHKLNTRRVRRLEMVDGRRVRSKTGWGNQIPRGAGQRRLVSPFCRLVVVCWKALIG